jgi:hypothetical protein
MRKPDLIIGPPSDPYLYRWHLVKLFGFQLALHKMIRDDDDRALHDHRSWNISLVLRGGYFEVKRVYWPFRRGGMLGHEWKRDAAGRIFLDVTLWRRPLSLIFRDATTPHRLMLAYPGRTSWSLWLRGPSVREWGFHCPKGWRHWRDFTAEADYNTDGVSTIGPGCD